MEPYRSNSCINYGRMHNIPPARMGFVHGNTKRLVASEGRRQDPTATKHKGPDLISAQPRSALYWDARSTFHRFVHWSQPAGREPKSQTVPPPPTAKRSRLICISAHPALSLARVTALFWSALRSCLPGGQPSPLQSDCMQAWYSSSDRLSHPSPVVGPSPGYWFCGRSYSMHEDAQGSQRLLVEG